MSLRFWGERSGFCMRVLFWKIWEGCFVVNLASSSGLFVWVVF